MLTLPAPNRTPRRRPSRFEAFSPPKGPKLSSPPRGVKRFQTPEGREAPQPPKGVKHLQSRPGHEASSQAGNQNWRMYRQLDNVRSKDAG